jgi:hypothetical protein
MIFEITLSMSFLLTLVVVMRMYNAIRIINARVTVLSDLLKELRRRVMHAAGPATGASASSEDATQGQPGAAAPHGGGTDVMAALAGEVSRLESSIAKDFSLASGRRGVSATPAQNAPASGFAQQRDPIRRLSNRR